VYDQSNVKHIACLHVTQKPLLHADLYTPCNTSRPLAPIRGTPIPLTLIVLAHATTAIRLIRIVLTIQSRILHELRLAQFILLDLPVLQSKFALDGVLDTGKLNNGLAALFGALVLLCWDDEDEADEELAEADAELVEDCFAGGGERDVV
jgi:hypothetical protein